jgi:hypothetical protein
VLRNTSRTTSTFRQTLYNTILRNTSRSTTTTYNTVACNDFYRTSAGFSKPAFLCSSTTSIIAYSPTNYGFMGVGDYVYTNSGCSSVLSSGNYGINFNNSSYPDKVISIGAGGLITNVFSCSDRKYKKNIKLIGVSESGINIYSFEYVGNMMKKGVYQGVMADEVSFASLEFNNDLFVDYSKVDVEFKRIS